MSTTLQQKMKRIVLVLNPNRKFRITSIHNLITCQKANFGWLSYSLIYNKRIAAMPTHPMTIRALWTELQELHTNISKMVVVQIDLDGDYGDYGD